jgi:drug/metabolite transporter (DMT)-like permease
MAHPTNAGPVAVEPRTIALLLLALVAFASNSLLTRLALGAGEIDAAAFTCLRLVAGAGVLALLAGARARRRESPRGRGLIGPCALFAYAAPFSFAYLRIGAAVGALVLFGVVQLTMLGYGIARGERPSARSWIGLALACAGLSLLTWPCAARPDLLGLALMAVAGVAWGVYSLAGRRAPDPLASNAQSFLWSSPLALALLAAWPEPLVASGRGVALALLSGGVTSGLGYAIWYRALPRLSVLQASVSQLCVPVLAAAGAVAFLGEELDLRLTVSSAVVLGGVGLALSARPRSRA